MKHLMVLETKSAICWLDNTYEVGRDFHFSKHVCISLDIDLLIKIDI